MFKPRALTRREFLRCAALGSAALCSGWPAVRAWARGAAFEPDVWLQLTAAPGVAPVRGGAETPVWSYRARVLRGDPGCVSALAGSYLGPVLHLQRGEKLRVDFVNGTDQPSIVNWHGLHVPARMLGLPRYAAQPGGAYRYEFTVDDRAGTYWYHAMSAGHTPEQVYFGLAGLLVVHDPEEAALALPRGDQDLPIVIQDRDFGGDNQFTYPLGGGPRAVGAGTRTAGAGGVPGHAMMRDSMAGGGMMGGRTRAGMGGMMTRVMGFFGDNMLVNGHPDAVLEVPAATCRLRVLNASNSRIYKLAWDDGRPLVVIATGGGLLAAPTARDYVMLAPGQRVGLWADFSGEPLGRRHTLVSLEFKGTMGMLMDGGMPGAGMLGRMMRSSLPAPGSRFPICGIRIVRGGGRSFQLPGRLASIQRLRTAAAVNAAHPRTFRIGMSRMRWTFNGRSFEMGQVAPDEIVKLGSTEIWEFANDRMMAHAIHVHGLQFQVLERLDSPQHDDVLAGCVDDGWEDTVLVLPGERVRVIMRFADFTGAYAYQCHMLEHAADGLMRNYRVVA